MLESNPEGMQKDAPPSRLFSATVLAVSPHGMSLVGKLAPDLMVESRHQSNPNEGETPVLPKNRTMQLGPAGPGVSGRNDPGTPPRPDQVVNEFIPSALPASLEHGEVTLGHTPVTELGGYPPGGFRVFTENHDAARALVEAVDHSQPGIPGNRSPGIQIVTCSIPQGIFRFSLVLHGDSGRLAAYQ
jgi:hypothetical protein